jgi:hypothetical protein
VLAPVGPNWFGSPQHFAAGAILALAIALLATRLGSRWWLAGIVGVGVTSAAEIALKLAEYLYVHLTNGTISQSAYYDSLVDNTTTLVGALVGAALGLAAVEYRTRQR